MTRILFGSLLALAFVLHVLGACSVLMTTPPPRAFLAASFPLSRVTERLMSFDKNNDHQVSRDELPERMQGLIARGDRNADGALDLEEMGPLVNTEAPERMRVSSLTERFDGLPGVINDLKLSPSKHERAMAILSAYEASHNGNIPTGNTLYGEMRALLDHEEYENFVAATARLNRRTRAMASRLQ